VTSPLVICLGHPLRGDDGFGPAVAARLRDRGFPVDRLRTVDGLLPELAADVAAADAVLFVDAAADLGHGEVRVAPVPVGAVAPRWTHSLSPSDLLALAAAVYGRVPPATLVAAGGHCWDVGAALSPELESRVDVVAGIAAAWRESVQEACKEPSLSR
jgi:hydrogenase maturation protease